MHTPDFRGQTVDRYFLTDIIGSGGSGCVYRGVDMTSKHHKPYAIKWLPKSVPRYHWNKVRREINIHRAVNGSPHVLRLRHIIEEDNCLFLVLDLCETDMSKAIRMRTYWGNDALIKMAFTEVVSGLIDCHAQRIYHRDIKVANILCKADGTGIKIGDFGLATDRRVRRDGGCGTSNYISPECWASDETHPYDSRLMDVWSLGIVLFKMVTTRYPWEVALPSDKEFRAFIVNEDHLYETHPISEPLSTLLKWILHPNPTMRLTLPDIRERVQEMDTFYKWHPPPSTAPLSGEVGLSESDATCVDTGDLHDMKNKATKRFRGRDFDGLWRSNEKGKHEKGRR